MLVTNTFLSNLTLWSFGIISVGVRQCEERRARRHRIRQPACLLSELVVYICASSQPVDYQLRRKARKLPHKAPRSVKNNFPFTGALGFWTKRWEFYTAAIKHSHTGNFSFHVGSNLLIGLSGEKSRRVFFETRELDLDEG